MKYFAKLILVAVTILACSSCHKKDFPDNLTCIPQNATLVANVDLEKLIEKSNIKDFKTSGLYTLLNQDLLTDEPSLRALLENPEKSGIAFKQIFGFVTIQNGFGISLELKDDDDFKDAIEKFLKEENIDSPIYKTPDFYFLAIPTAKDNTLLMWDKHKAIIFTKTTRYDAEKIFKTTKETSIVKQKDYAEFYKTRKDISVWGENKTLYKLLGQHIQNPFLNLDDNATAGTYSHVNLEFLKGEIKISNKVTPTDSVAKMDKHIFNAQPDNELLKYLPSKNLVMLKASLNTATLFAQMGDAEDLAMLLSPKLIQAIHSIKGDVVLTLLNSSEYNLPQVAIGITAKDESLKNVLLNEVYKTSPKSELGGYTEVRVSGLTVFVAQKNTHLLISNNENVIRFFVKGQTVPASMASVKDIKESPAYFYMNLDFNSYPLMLKSYMQSFGLGDKFNAAIMFKDVEAKYNPKETTSRYTIRMKDDKQNSFAALINGMGKMN